MKRKMSFNLVLVILASILAIGFMEMILRNLYPIYNPHNFLRYVKSPLGMRLLPKNKMQRQWRPTGEFDVTIKSNRHGFRDEKDFVNASRNDWFVVGDSFAMGHGIERQYRFSDILQKLIKKDVYNISIPNTITGYHSLIDYAINQGASIQNLIVSICMENDLMDYRLMEKQKRSFQLFKTFLANHFAVYNIVTHYVHLNKALKRVFTCLGLIMKPYSIPRNNTYSKNILDQSVSECVLIKEAYPLMNIVFLIIPSRLMWLDSLDMDLNSEHTYFVNKLIEETNEVIDLKEIMNSGDDPGKYYYPVDGHWNKEGHAFAAHAVYNRLLSLYERM